MLRIKWPFIFASYHRIRPVHATQTWPTRKEVTVPALYWRYWLDRWILLHPASQVLAKLSQVTDEGMLASLPFVDLLCILQSAVAKFRKTAWAWQIFQVFSVLHEAIVPFVSCAPEHNVWGKHRADIFEGICSLFGFENFNKRSPQTSEWKFHRADEKLKMNLLQWESLKFCFFESRSSTRYHWGINPCRAEQCIHFNHFAKKVFERTFCAFWKFRKRLFQSYTTHKMFISSFSR